MHLPARNCLLEDAFRYSKIAILAPGETVTGACTFEQVDELPHAVSRTFLCSLFVLVSSAAVGQTSSAITGQTGIPGSGLGGGSVIGGQSSGNCLDPTLGCMNSLPLTQTQTGLPVSGAGINAQGYGTGNIPFSNNSNGAIYVDSAGFTSSGTPTNQQQNLPPQPITDLQRMARESTGILLPIFGQDLFSKAPSTFAPVDQIPVTPDYVIGPGDEILLRIWGHTSLNSRLTVDRAGNIYIPQVGSVHVSGQHFADLQPLLQHELGRTYRNFEFSADLGHLRSIQVFVMGEARRPGSYTVSALSTVFNAIFSSGGPSQQGSLRKIEIRRNGAVAQTVDLYDFLLSGDKSKDVALQAGDVIFIPFVGPQVAISGAVRHPAIYEINGTSSIDDLLKLAGGFTATAAESRLSVERIENHRERRAITIALDPAGLSTKLNDGDVLRADSVLRGYRDSVTIRGNLANAGRFPWHPGMRLSEIVPDRESLLTPDYWDARNKLGLPTPLFMPAQPAPVVSGGQQAPGTAAGSQAMNQGSAAMTGDTSQVMTGVTAPTTGPTSDSTAAPTIPSSSPTRLIGATQQRDEVLPNATQRAGQSTVAEQQESASDRLAVSTVHQVNITIAAPEIDWSYATIERLDPNTLRNSLVPFNLGRLVQDHDEAEDKLLKPGDVVTILSQSDIHVSQDEQTKYIRLEGEFGSSGVYSVAPGETLADVVKRAGGLTRNAYLYGSSFTRESARVLQQQRLDEYIASVERQEERTGSIRALSATTPYAISQTSDERALIEQLRKMRATGRVVLEFMPETAGEAAIPDLPLENGDSFRVPSRPAIVSVVGSVYGQNVFLYNNKRRVGDYLTLAGKQNRIADKAHSFVIRADGSVLSKETVKGGLWSNNFDATLVFPGDTIVVPEKPAKPSVVKDLLDYATILSSFGVGAAAITVLK
jgi:protein involved in polysaccharide export with SLBB domain